MTEIPARSLADAPATLEAGARERRGPGRPTLYTDEIAAEICSRISDGETLSAICREPGKPKRSTVRGWLFENEAFSRDYARARAEHTHAIVEEIGDIARGATPEDAQAVRVRIDALKWIASRLLPKVYGDRVEITSKTAAAEDMTDDDLATIASRSGAIAAEKAGG